MSKEYKCAPPQSTHPNERWGQHAHPNARTRRSLTGSSRGLYKRNGDLIAIPHKVAGANWKLVEDQAMWRGRDSWAQEGARLDVSG